LSRIVGVLLLLLRHRIGLLNVLMSRARVIKDMRRRTYRSRLSRTNMLVVRLSEQSILRRVLVLNRILGALMITSLRHVVVCLLNILSLISILSLRLPKLILMNILRWLVELGQS
jgi:hypothetical protein